MQRDNSQKSFNNQQNQYSEQQNQIPIDTSIKHYELPNLTQLLYDFTNKEQDTIQQCFRTGNYTSLRDMPAHMMPNAIAKALREKQDANLLYKPPAGKVVNLTGGGLFRDFEWMPEPYDAFLKQKGEEKQAQKQKQKLISNTDFLTYMDKATWKYHDCFLSEEQRKNYVLPYFVSDDPYEASEEEMLRAKWLHENKIVSGDFRPALNDKSLERLTPGQLPDMVNYLKKIIMIDWAEVNFVIGTNPDSFVEVKFDMKSVDTELGLKAYMNTLVKTHDVISQFQFKRVIKFWGYRDNGFMYFMLAPNWIKFNPGITYAGILNQQLDDANRGPDQNQTSEIAKNLTEGMSPSEQNLFKIHQLVFKKSNFIKEPQLFSKDIEV